MGCSTSKDGSAPAAATPSEYAPKAETMSRDTKSNSHGAESTNTSTKEGQFQLLVTMSKSTNNTTNYESLISSTVMKEYCNKGMKEDDIHSLFEIVDADRNGLINYKEYVELLEMIELAVAEKKRVASTNQSRPLPAQPNSSVSAVGTTNVDNPVKGTKSVDPVKPVEVVKPIVIAPVPVVQPSAAPAPAAAEAPSLVVPEKATEGPKRRPPSKRMVHIPTGEEPAKAVTPVAGTGVKVMQPFGVASPKSPMDAAKKSDTIKEGEQEEEEDDDNDPNKPKQKKGFLINDDGASDPSTAKNYYVLDNGKLKYMDHATKQYQVIPLNNRKVQVSSDGVIELISTEDDAGVTSSGESTAASPLSEDGRRNSLNSISPKSRISLRVKNERDVDQWRAAIAEHQQYASTKEESRVASMRLTGGSRSNSVSVPTETDSRKH